ncbi:MAG: tRNA pseudouridine(13) synthase TruD [Patescibacteria group bacterium]|jgi:TruD family tRNA pseudouridine synthase
MDLQEAFVQQKILTDKVRQTQPELFKIERSRTEAEIFKIIGIDNLPQNRPLGYLRLYPEDFLVEEITKEDKLIKINEFNDNFPDQKNSPHNTTLYAHLIKIGIPTHHAIEKISQALKIDRTKIGFAGLKDSDALTAQQIAFPGLKITPQEIKAVKIPHICLTDFYYGQNTLSPGNLHGNCFTITIRTEQEIDASWLKARVNILKTHGFLNYFQSQRFGGTRLNGHLLGKLVAKGQYQQAITTFLFQTNNFNLPYANNLRKSGEQAWPDLNEIKKLFLNLPYYFNVELKIIDYLLANPQDYQGALNAVPDHTRIWVHAYTSWLFNKHLSDFSQNHGCTTEIFTLPLNGNKNDDRPYQKYLTADDVKDYKKHLLPFRFIGFRKQTISGRVKPQNVDYRIFKQGAIINFSLPPGCYATTFLANLFNLQEGLPIPLWVTREKIDAKALMNQGNLNELKEIFKEEWYSKAEKTDV